MKACPACGHDEHVGRCFWNAFVNRRYVTCACKIRRKSEDLDVDEDAIATYLLNQALRQHGEVIIVKDNEP